MKAEVSGSRYTGPMLSHYYHDHEYYPEFSYSLMTTEYEMHYYYGGHFHGCHFMGRDHENMDCCMAHDHCPRGECQFKDSVECNGLF